MSAEDIDRIFAASGKLLNGRKNLAQSNGIAESALEHFYGFCFHEYQAGKYEDAARSLELLCLYHHENPKYWLALGSCREKLHDFRGAAAALYMGCAYQPDGQGATRVRIAENLLACGDVPQARDFANEALAMELDEEYRNRAEALLDAPAATA